MDRPDDMDPMVIVEKPGQKIQSDAEAEKFGPTVFHQAETDGIGSQGSEKPERKHKQV
jgi:hypothetical protein